MLRFSLCRRSSEVISPRFSANAALNCMRTSLAKTFFPLNNSVGRQSTACATDRAGAKTLTANTSEVAKARMRVQRGSFMTRADLLVWASDKYWAVMGKEAKNVRIRNKELTLAAFGCQQ